MFRVNKDIRLKLESGKTFIYVQDRLFLQCAKIVLSIGLSNFESFQNVESIDKVLGEKSLLDTEMIRIPPEVEFWAHCSNLQTWVENNYDSRLLHSNLALPLLNRLAETGDSLSRKVLRKEILERLGSSENTVVFSLLQGNYLQHFSEEERIIIFEDNISKFETSNLILPFLRIFDFFAVHIASAQYKRIILSKMIGGSCKEKKEILQEHIDIFSKDDLMKYLKEYGTRLFEHSEKGCMFEVLSLIIRELQFSYNVKFSNFDIIDILLEKNEQNALLVILNNSLYPYKKLNFEDDEVRRRVWNKMLYYELYEGNLTSVELVCDNINNLLVET